ncbi:hypothetical protein DM02DRAFT_653358 [Periconia macrospinosa]|uniref:NACHT domain-containing protein n=1 Tax=Periconia macrospinosa TaxID=97972 RepID=A0A2V1DXE5_9PLEO|nr:hypothetical protein DM02DRAFT_653358 [Periconia macrospinosa]
MPSRLKAPGKGVLYKLLSLLFFVIPEKFRVLDGTRFMIMSSSQAPTTDLWQEAVKKYTYSFPEKHQKAFKTPSTVEQCMQILESKSSRKKGYTRFLQVLNPLIDPLKRIERSIDVVVQTSAGIGSPIWGPLRLAITVASDHFEILERLTFIVRKITNSIQRVQDFEVLFASQKAISLLYADLVDFCTRVIRFYASEEIDRAAAAAHMKEAKALREKILMDRESDALHRLQRWLTATPMADELQNHLNEYMDGSCEWILSTTSFKQWYDAPLYSSLRIEGRPGCGKSTLAAYLVRHLSSSAPVLYFFCDGKNSEKRSTSTILRTLLSQLLFINPTVASALIPIQQQTGRELVEESSEIMEAFQAAIKKNDNPLYCLVDAVDECEWSWGDSPLVPTPNRFLKGQKPS